MRRITVYLELERLHFTSNDKKKLSNHSFLHSFLIKKENGITLLRGKKYPQDTCEWLPKEGIELLASNVDLNSVIPVAPMRIEKLNLDAVYMGVVTKYIHSVSM